MLQPRRLIVSTLSGLLFGFVCLGLASRGPSLMPWPAAVDIVLSRTLIGVAIGISSLRIGHWSIHGLILGAIFSVPLAFSGLMAPDNPNVTHAAMFSFTIILGAIYGFLIEIITSVLFKARTEGARS